MIFVKAKLKEEERAQLRQLAADGRRSVTSVASELLARALADLREQAAEHREAA